MIVYALDPGNKSGFVIVDVEWFMNPETKIKDFRIVSILDYGEFVYPKDVRAQLHKARTAEVIVIEDFIVRKSLIGDKIFALRCLGAFESLWPDRVIFQQPSEKARVPDSILKAHSCWNRSPHIRDAFRHLFIYLYKQRQGKTKSDSVKTLRGRLNDRKENS